MAFSYVGGNENGGSSTSATVTHGLSISTGDLVVVYLNYNNSTGSITPSETWDGSSVDAPSGETAQQAIYWMIAGSSEPATYTFTLGTSTNWRVLIKVFSSTTDAEIDSVINFAAPGALTTDVVCDAISGQTISDDALSIVAGGKDTRRSSEAYTTADNSYVSVIGQTDDQLCAMSHRIFTTGTSSITSVRMETADGNDGRNDKPYSVHVSFVESTTGGQTITVGQITESESLFSPGVVIDQSVSIGLLTESESLFSVAPILDQSITTGQIDESESLFSATPTMGDVVVVNLISEIETINSVVVIFDQSVSTGLLTESESLFSPTSTVNHSVATGQIDESESLFAATPSPVITVSVGQIIESESLFSPSIIYDQVISTGLIEEQEQLFAAALGAATLGGVYNAASYFATGSTVTIELYDPVTGSAISLSNSSCEEVDTTGVFVWDNSKLTAQPTGYQEYLWRMTDSTNFQGGVIRMFDQTASDQINELYKRFDLDVADPNTYENNGSVISNSTFTLTKTDNGDGTFDVVKS